MGRWVCALSWISALVSVGIAPMLAEEPVVPVYHEPHHRQVFQYGSTRILDVQIPPGDTSWYHTHDSPILYVTLSAGQIRTQNLGQEWGVPGRGRGPGPAATGATPPIPPQTVDATAGRSSARLSSTTTYGEHPVTHRVQNIGEQLFRPIGVINESAGDDATTEQAAGFDGKPELTNRWFRAYRFTLAAGESTPSHRHKTPVVLIQTTDGRAISAGAMKFELNEPGRWAFFDAGDPHQTRNTGNAGVELIEVEVRQPAR
jgi:quercetin dioxygenase-like cupin family protein